MSPSAGNFLGTIVGWVVGRRSTVIGVGALAISPYGLVAGAPLPVNLSSAHQAAPSPDLKNLLSPPDTVPGAPQLAPGTRAQAGDPPPPPVAHETARDIPHGMYGIPGVVLKAYKGAERRMAAAQPGCNLPWWLLAGIGKVESNHADDGYVDRSGRTKRPILGPVLNGRNGVAAISDTDNGRWDGDTTWDRAVGPMQFIPTSWRRWSGGDPNNVYQSAMAAGRYLCAAGGNLGVPGRRADAVFAYNHSNSYVRLVLSWAHAYSGGGGVPIPVRSTPPPPEQTGVARHRGHDAGTGGDDGHDGGGGRHHGGGGKNPGSTGPGPIDVGPQPGDHGGDDGGSGAGGDDPTTPPVTDPPGSTSPTPTPTTGSPTPTPTTESPTPSPTPVGTTGS